MTFLSASALAASLPGTFSKHECRVGEGPSVRVRAAPHASPPDPLRTANQSGGSEKARHVLDEVAPELASSAFTGACTYRCSRPLVRGGGSLVDDGGSHQVPWATDSCRDQAESQLVDREEWAALPSLSPSDSALSAGSSESEHELGDSDLEVTRPPQNALVAVPPRLLPPRLLWLSARETDLSRLLPPALWFSPRRRGLSSQLPRGNEISASSASLRGRVK